MECIIFALPKTCHLKDDEMYLLQSFMINRLKEKMTDEEILLAHDEEQPHLDKMRDITCRRCNISQCAHSFKSMTAKNFGFSELTKGQPKERVEKLNQFLSRLISAERKKVLDENGITFATSQVQSGGNPKMFIAFKKNGRYARIRCEFGKRKIIFEFKEAVLISIEQIHEQIDIAINYLIKICGE